MTGATGRTGGRTAELLLDRGQRVRALVRRIDERAERPAALAIHVTIVEPGFFRTDFLDPASLNSDIDVIDDCAPTAGAMRAAVPSLNHAQPGDPVKAAHTIVEIAATPEQPLRLPLGDTLQAFDTELGALRKEMDTWRHVALSTDHDQGCALYGEKGESSGTADCRKDPEAQGSWGQRTQPERTTCPPLITGTRADWSRHLTGAFTFAMSEAMAYPSSPCTGFRTTPGSTTASYPS
ncbi:hypothetical protein [Streptomyces hokutonensis]|uniref:hypothetical protein n=1 Tax=Streptomyces hokutonensis TaxID=1306990 RepID=UPI0036803477